MNTFNHIATTDITVGRHAGYFDITSPQHCIASHCLGKGAILVELSCDKYGNGMYVQWDLTFHIKNSIKFLCNKDNWFQKTVEFREEENMFSEMK